ncbi:MAG: hypothetical protein IIA66_03255 [Planctomycetes bacterium]|nr:hypothetical protein [Planctomycetota bacterium]
MCCKRLAAITTIGLMLGCALDDRMADRAKIFDTIWQTVNEGFYDPTFGGVDWKAVGKQYRPKALGAESDEQFYRNLNAMLYELDASHLGVIPKEHPEWIGAPSVLAEGDVGVDAEKTAHTFGVPPQASALRVSAVLNYQKADAAFLDKLFGKEAGIRTPITALSEATMTIRVEQ